MALRHPVPSFDAALLGHDELKKVPMYGVAEMVGFRRDSKMDEVAKSVFMHHIVDLNAAVGSGKSVKFPTELAKQAANMLIVHVVPARHLACSLYEYVRAHGDDTVAYHYLDEVAIDFPSTGVLFTYSNAWAWNMAFAQRRGNVPNHCVYMDESHESDMGTTALRCLKTSLPGAKAYVGSTATAGTGASAFRKPELPSACAVQTYVEKSVSEWDVNAVGAPWSLSSFKHDVVVFTDDPQDVTILRQKYDPYGVEVKDFNAKSDPRVVVNYMKALKDQKANRGITLLVLDYSFRSGWTFPTVSRFIDTCKVRVTKYAPGGYSYAFRRANYAEITQTAGRGGRTADMPAAYFRPAYTPKYSVVDTESVEADAVTILFRALGFSAPQQFADRPFYRGNIPNRVDLAMSGDTPLRAYPSERLIPWPGSASAAATQDAGLQQFAFPDADDARSAFTVESSEDVAGNISPVQYERLYRRHTNMRAKAETVVDGDVPPLPHMESAVPRRDGFDHTSFQAAFQALDIALEGRADSVAFGEYCYVPGSAMPPGPRMYAGGFTEVQRVWARSDSGVYLPSADVRVRAEALSLAIDAYNESIAKCHAATFTVSEVARSFLASTAHADTNAVKHWKDELQREYLVNEALARAAMEIVCVLAPDSLKLMDPMCEVEAKYAAMYTAKLHSYAERRGVSDVGDYRTRLAASLNQSLIGAEHQFQGNSLGRVGLAGKYVLDAPPKDFRARVAGYLYGERPIIARLTEANLCQIQDVT